MTTQANHSELHNYVMVTRLMREEVQPSFSMISSEKKLVEKVAEELPQVSWVASYAIMGPWDYLDVFQAPDNATAMKVSVLVRHYGGAHTEVWPATEWKHFEKKIKSLSHLKTSS